MKARFSDQRRRFLKTLVATLPLAPLLAKRALGQLAPFEITLRRDSDLSTTLNLNDCVMGQLFLGAGSVSNPGTVICDTLELPFRNELQEVSCIRPGTYSAFVKTAPTAEGVDLGWRLQLEGTKQLAIQIHTGNTTSNTRGCRLVGTRSSNACELAGGTSRP